MNTNRIDPRTDASRHARAEAREERFAKAKAQQRLATMAKSHPLSYLWLRASQREVAFGGMRRSAI
jgi:hypothetical protein